jgi:hypothetical protein
MNKQEIKEIIKPESGVELAICEDEEFIVGANYGKSRPGHPEGAVIYHIEEVLGNIDKFFKDDEDRTSLRLIAITHDTFKNKVNQNLPKQGDNHHGFIAKKFAEKFCHDTNVLQVILLHDDAYNAWSAGGRHEDWYKAKRRAEKLISDLNALDSLELYLKFYRCDNLTGDKSQDNYEWFNDLIQ